MARNTVLLCVLWTCILCWAKLCWSQYVYNIDIIPADVTWRQSDSPITIRRSQRILEGITLTIEAGTEVRFLPGVMLAVNGTLIAQGTPQAHITLTNEPGFNPGVPEWPRDIRLVDERSVAYGRLQLNHKGQWRGICANHQNWTKSDTDVACRQLGFDRGNFSFWSWATNDSLFMLYHRPQCIGSEASIADCPGYKDTRIGARVCQNQQTIHLFCEGLADTTIAKRHWWGLEFYNSSIVRTIDGSKSINESASILSNVDILYAGMDMFESAVPAVRASPYAPHLINVTIKHCALDATNFTQLLGSTVVYNSVMENNRGHGLVAETNLGRMFITNSRFSGNGGNGIKAKFLDGKYPIFDEARTFCRQADLRGGFPLLISGIPSLSPPCTKRFEAGYHERITMNVLEMDIEPTASAQLEVYDGQSDNSRLLATLPIVNGTLPRGVTSTYYQMFVKFVWQQLPLSCPTLRDCVKFTLLIDSSPGPATLAEFSMNNTLVENNTQHGMYVENVRNYVFINASQILHNNYGAGIRVFGGAGDVHVNSSRVEYNQDNGVNITYGGGMRIFNQSSFSHNYGNGINITLNETRVDNRTRYSLSKYNEDGLQGRNIERTEVSQSTFELNNGYGVRVGNFCSAGRAIVNDSSFVQNRRDAIEFESCYKIIPDKNITNFTIGYNRFDGNYGHAIKISPLINAVGRISNNTFSNHPRHTLRLDNTHDFLNNRFWLSTMVEYEVMGNDFYYNKGFYVVNVRLTEGGSRQKMDFKYNVFRENLIEGAFPTLNERTRAYAVAIVSSSNVNFSRNSLVNTGSKYEIATHLLDRSVTLETTRQWWGTTDYVNIIERIFDQFSRYDLATINYHPVLKYDDLYGPWITDDQRPEEVAFDRGDVIGGRLAYQYRTQPGKKYSVDRDISVTKWGTLIVSPGTTLEFSNAMGILVQGKVNFEGNPGQLITLKLGNETTILNSTRVRLADGDTEFEGRVEVRPSVNDEWGTVCDEGWTILDASVVCQMLGLVVHPGDWKSYIGRPGPSYQPIWRSHVQCDTLDMDIMECEADGIDDHSCTHDTDVYVRCKPPTWAGIRFLATAQSSRMVYTTIQHAGLLDPTAILYSPALRIDYNIHTLEHLNIVDNQDDGVEILHNDVYANARITHSTVSRNFGNGVSIRGSFFELYMCELHDNYRSGFEYNPHYTTFEAMQMRVGIEEPRVFDRNQSVDLPNEAFVFWVTKSKLINESQTYELEVYVSALHRVVMDILDYDPDTEQEKITVYDSRASTINPGTLRWTVEDDLVDFPVATSGTFITIRWTVKGTASGRFTFVLRSKPWDWRWPFAYLKVSNTTTSNNEHGIVTRHYNQPSNEYLDLFFRYRWETIEMFGVKFLSNRFEALHVPSITKYHELYMPSFEELQRPYKLAEITYQIDACHFEQNGGGVVAEHNHVEFSNNVWIWQVTNNRFERNFEGGFKIELPKVNLLYTELFNHSVDINDTIFEDNKLFEFRIDGFYCNSSIARNRFQGNTCKLGCITITGTEKDFEMFDNEVVENRGKYIVEINMNSHTPYTRWVDSTIMYNNFKRNRKLEEGLPPSVASKPTSYTLGIKGLQNVTVNRNLFSNSLDFELVGGMSSSLLENYLDVRENWWGTADQVVIQEKIFDFDNWNNYAIAEYYPYLLGDNFDSQMSTGGKLEPVLDLSKPFGGRIEQDITLRVRPEPYIIRSDLTVMPRATLFIEKGAELQFYPNIGIMVLGAMTAIGEANNKVKLGPVPVGTYRQLLRNSTMNSGTSNSGRKKRAGEDVLNHEQGPRQDLKYQVRLNGGDSSKPYEGFIELYNTTERRWSIVCDSNFHERTAEVACKDMGMESTNVQVRRTRWYDHFVLGYPIMHEQKVEWFWRRTFICDGSESSLTQCRYRINYHLLRCMEEQEYVFVRCGPRNLAENFDYWGNLRYSTPEYEQGSITPGYSYLKHVDIYGAGKLHENYVAAVQAIHRTPESDYVRITHSASNGFDYIAPRSAFELLHSVIENNNGYAVGGLVLNGESRYEVPKSSFVPLKESTIPYNVFGLVRMCTTEKLIWIKDRLLLYFKYNFQTVDCIKIIRSREPRKQIALRFLQFNLYNDSFYENAVEMYNGEYYEPELQIGKVTGNSSEDEISIKYQTGQYFDSMGIRVTASAGHGDYGFIAEVVTLPLSPGWRPDLGPGDRQRIAYSSMTGNEAGGFSFSNAGELNPTVIIESNRIQNNGLRLLNMTSPPMVGMYVQNTKLVTVANNYIVDNGGGGIVINTTTYSLTNALYANITNNVINYNTHGVALHIEGHHFQGVTCRNNFIGHNYGEHRNVLSMFGIHLNFTNNVVFNNTGQTILNATVPEKVSINQNYRQNSFYDNYAFAQNKSTVFVGSAKHSFRDNYFVNRWNVFELVTFNRTKYVDGVYPDVEAMYNWWGGGSQSFVSGRIWDRRDDDNLIRVAFEPFYQTNQSVLEGRCYPGWRLFEKKCYWYFGGVVPYHVAEQNCKVYRGRLAWARDHHGEKWLGDVVASAQENYNEYWMTWVYSERQKEGLCTILIKNTIQHIDCNALLPSICERDPYVQPEIDWYWIYIAAGVAGGVLVLFVPMCIVFACLKARARKKQKIDRRTTLRASLRASKMSVYLHSGAAQADEVRYQRRRRPPLSKSDNSVLDISGVTLDETTDSVEKTKLYGLDSHRPSTPNTTLDYSSSGKVDNSSYFDSDLGPVRHHQDGGYYPPRLENEIANINTRPNQYDQMFRNNGFDEKSLDRSLGDVPYARPPGAMNTSYGGASYGPSSRGASSHGGPANSSYSYGNPSYQGNSSSQSGGRPAGHSVSSGKIDWDEIHPPRARDQRPPRPKPKESAM